ncbi:MAG: Smr/MutS family protein [Candidatus Sericytochromatia bacterium]
MKSEGAAYGPLWAALLESLALEAPGPASRTLCLNLRPAWERTQVQQLHRQTSEMQLLLQHSSWPAEPQQPDWLKPLLAQPGAQTRDLQQFLTALEALRTLLQRQAQALPELWKLGQDLQPEASLLASLQPGRPLSREAHRLLQQRQSRLKAQQDLLARLGLVCAKARFGLKHQGVLAGIGGSQRLKLLRWVPARLSQLQLEFELGPELQVLILTGAHGAGKSRLLQSLFLACLMHQAGLPLRCAPESVLPVFSGLWMFESEGLNERLERLKPLLRHPQSERLILIDNYLAETSPGEGYALGRATLARLSVKGSLTVLSTHHPLLARLAGPNSPIRLLGLQREGSRQGGALQLLWDQIRGAGLIERARQAGWPSDLLQQAEALQQELQNPPRQTQPTPAAAKKPLPPDKKKPGLKPISSKVPAGSRVYLPTLNLYGELLSPPDRRARVQVQTQGMTLEVPADQVVLSSHRKEKKGDTSGVRIQTWSETAEACDLHGLTVDEALPLLDKFLDTAWYQGLGSVRIIHGKGTSALRRAVHLQLEQIPFVRSFRLGHPGEGDSGVTVVELGD